MNILYHLSSPWPRIPDTDAVFQEAEFLRRRFGGGILQLYPLRRPSRIYPKQLYGLHRIAALRRLEKTTAIHHLYYATLYPFPWLRFLRRPLVYSAIAGAGILPGGRRPDWLKRVHTLVTSNPRDAAVFKSWPGARYRLIRPGIDTARFTHTPCPLERELTLLVGSAPWIRRQFAGKGIDLLLQLAASGAVPVRLVFLWRGWLADELKTRVVRYGLTPRVEIINEWIDVNRVLARVHATVVLADSEKLVKAFPHSLMESLAAGKPALVSACIPMADYVRATQCGEVVSAFTQEALQTAALNLMRNYAGRRAAALARGRVDFALEPMLSAYGEVYAEAGRTA
ncbi:MAG: glycosyltransferase [Kiritimatiellae bacterium]|jgi:glycosyltransferase involved in cell wall biosynthesis|nr:glycosyltransferase [Kiritimatiellia bacterium]